MAHLVGDSADSATPGVQGKNTSADPKGIGVEGVNDAGWGVYGRSDSGRGVEGKSDTNYGMRAHSRSLAGLRASSVESRGVEGSSEKGEGVAGHSKAGHGVWGATEAGAGTGAAGVAGTSQNGYGVSGESRNAEGVRGVSHGGMGGTVGVNTAGGPGMYGTSEHGPGVFGISVHNEGIHAESKSRSTAAMAVYQRTADSDTAALFVKHDGLRTAGYFEGNVIVTGDITLSGADCAEDFDIAEGSAAGPGTVMVVADEATLGDCCRPYDSRVAGVVSGAGSYKPALVLDKQPATGTRRPIALVGKVHCKVDADFAPIAIGDLLTTSSTVGHAMRAADPVRAHGAIIGKALRPLASGKGLIPILIALQ